VDGNAGQVSKQSEGQASEQSGGQAVDGSSGQASGTGAGYAVDGNAGQAGEQSKGQAVDGGSGQAGEQSGGQAAPQPPGGGQASGTGAGRAGGSSGAKRKSVPAAAIVAIAAVAFAAIVAIGFILYMKHDDVGAEQAGGAQAATVAAPTPQPEPEPSTSGSPATEAQAAAAVTEIPETMAPATHATAPATPAAAPAQDGEGGPPPVAELAGLEISQPDFRYMLNYFKSMILLNSGIEAGSEEERNFWEQDIGGGTTMLDYAKENTLASLEELMICVSIANERGIALDGDDIENVDTQIQMLKDRFGGQEELEQITQAEYGISVAELTAVNERFMLRQKVFDAEKSSMEVAADEARSYYELNIDQFDTVTVQHILFLYEGGDASEPRSDAESLKLAEDMLERLRGGEDMTALALEYSEDSGVLSNGGIYTFSRNDNLAREFIDWSFAAEAGDMGIVETAYGYHVMRLVSRDLAPFGVAEPGIVDTIKSQMMESVVAEWMDEPKYEAAVDEDVLAGII
jgi:parvulin-like peptidyl-prolyl isomerase